MYWAVGRTESGDVQVLGPFDMREQADVEIDISHLSGVRVISAPSAEQAVRAVMGRRGVNRQQSSDEPMPAPPNFE